MKTWLLFFLFMTGTALAGDGESHHRLSWAPTEFLKQGFRTAPWVRDPFFPAEAPFKLSGIISRELAFINGQWVRVGEVVDGFRVKEIRPDAVTIARRNTVLVLKLE